MGRRRRDAPGGGETGLAVQRILQRLRGRELGGLRRGDGDGLARTRVTALARLAGGDAEGAEAVQAGFATSGEGLGDGVKRGLDHLVGRGLGQAGGLGNLAHELLLIHWYCPYGLKQVRAACSATARGREQRKSSQIRCFPRRSARSRVWRRGNFGAARVLMGKGGSPSLRDLDHDDFTA